MKLIFVSFKNKSEKIYKIVAHKPFKNINKP